MKQINNYDLNLAIENHQKLIEAYTLGDIIEKFNFLKERLKNISKEHNFFRIDQERPSFLGLEIYIGGYRRGLFGLHLEYGEDDVPYIKINIMVKKGDALTGENIIDRLVSSISEDNILSFSPIAPTKFGISPQIFSIELIDYLLTKQLSKIEEVIIR